MKQPYLCGALFLSGVLIGWGPLSSVTNWELSLVRKDTADQRSASAPAMQASSGSATQSMRARDDTGTEASQPATADVPSNATAGGMDSGAIAAAQDQPLVAPFHDPDEPPALAPPPHLSDMTEFASLFDAQDHLDERIDDIEAMIAAMERDGLPEEHIDFMRKSLLAEESIDPFDIEPLLDEPEPSAEEFQANIVDSYGSHGASPEEIQDMLDVMREDFDGSASRAAEFDLHSPPAPLDP